MKRHPKRRDIISAALLINSIKSKREKYVLSHIRDCQECAQKYDSIKSLLQPSDNASVNPSDQLETKILRSYNQLKHDNKSSYAFLSFSLRRYPKSITYTTASIILIFLAIFYSINREDNNYKPFSLSFNNIKGRAQINNYPKEINSVEQDSIIKLDNNSTAEIYYRNLLSLKLYGKTSIKVKQSLYDAKLNKYILAFDLTHGSINARFQHDMGLEYIFKTPHAVINSIGTEFMLQIQDKGTRLLLIEGKLKVKSLSSNYEITASEGKEYIIDSKIKIMDTVKNKKTRKKSGQDPKDKADNIINKNEAKKIEQKRSPSNKKNNKVTNKKQKEPRKEMRNARKSLRKEIRGDRKEMKKLRKTRKNF